VDVDLSPDVDLSLSYIQLSNFKKLQTGEFYRSKIFIFFQPTKLSVKSINPVDVADFHMRGVTSPEKDPPRVMSARKPIERFPRKFQMYTIVSIKKGLYI